MIAVEECEDNDCAGCAWCDAEPEVAALFVDPAGPYSSIPGVHMWDEKRDATTYTGPNPVVAHPPCARWCRMAKFVESQHGHKVGDDGGTFAAALAAVRRCGGVLEHPAWSLAWPAHGLPTPMERGWTRTFLAPNEWVAEVAQSAYGHEAKKPTWLLVVSKHPPADALWAKPRGTKVLARFAQRHPGDLNGYVQGREIMNAAETHITPPAFAEWLVRIARAAVVLLVLLALSVDGWGCAGAASSGEPDWCPEEEAGWICDAACLTCTCDGHVTPDPDTRGECHERIDL